MCAALTHHALRQRCENSNDWVVYLVVSALVNLPDARRRRPTYPGKSVIVNFIHRPNTYR
jgi:hypothetical protein